MVAAAVLSVVVAAVAAAAVGACGLKAMCGTSEKVRYCIEWEVYLACGTHTPGEDIRQEVLKKDGGQAQMNAIDKVIAHKTANPEWRGEDSSAGGRPSDVSAKEQKELTRLVFTERGKAIVTVSFCRKKLPYLKKVTRFVVQRALHRAGLAWLNRRRKCWVAGSVGEAGSSCMEQCSPRSEPWQK